MAYDKVVDSAALDAGLTQVADAIRAKAGTSDELSFPAGMESAINAIDTSEDLTTVLAEQEALIEEIKVTLESKAAGGGSTLPYFTFTGQYGIKYETETDWQIGLLSSGVFTPSENITIDACLVGGGGSGSASNRGGGGGGYTATHRGIVLTAGEPYTITVGAGGASATGHPGNDGGSTSAFGYTVNGGQGGQADAGGNGGSGGGGYNSYGAGGCDGGNGGGSVAGAGQGSTTRMFGEETGELCSGGGGSAGYNGGAGGSTDSNTGGGLGNGTYRGQSAGSRSDTWLIGGAGWDSLLLSNSVMAGGCGGGIGAGGGASSGSVPSGNGADGAVIIRNAR